VTDRRIEYDLMRVLGIGSIMLAHANPPETIFQLRNIGIPVLIAASAMTFRAIDERRPIEAPSFLWRRIWRLTVPVWVFLTLWFATVFAVAALAGKAQPFSADYVLNSYLFLTEQGFTWIFKVYILLALLTPMALRMRHVPVGLWAWGLMFIAILVMHHLLTVPLRADLATGSRDLVEDVLLIIVPYGALYLYAMRLPDHTDRQLLLSGAVAFAAFVLMAALRWQEAGHFVPTQTDKYPPGPYYLAYGLFGVHLVYLLFRRLPAVPDRVNGKVRWLASNSLWIYLWHIPACFAWPRIEAVAPLLADAFLPNAVFLFGVGIVATALQQRLVAIARRSPAPIPRAFVKVFA
jgi:hypothetical protein